MKTYWEESDDYDGYIKSKNLVIDTVEKIVSFIRDREYCREGFYFKQEVVRHVYGKRYVEVWPQVVEALKGKTNS